LIIGLFIIFNIDLFIINNTTCTLSPRLLNPIIQDPNSENIQENLEYLQEKLEAERKDYNNKKKSFDAKVKRLSDYFNNAISHIEFQRSNVIVYFKSSDNSPSVNT
jgi:esterase/lipase